MKYCSRYKICSAPKCPLDIRIDRRTEVHNEPKCQIAKATRHKYWESMPFDVKSLLPYQGYFKTELARMNAAKERWELLPESEKEEIRERMRNFRR
jgi:hypothetical protein